MKKLFTCGVAELLTGIGFCGFSVFGSTIGQVIGQSAFELRRKPQIQECVPWPAVLHCLTKSQICQLKLNLPTRPNRAKNNYELGLKSLLKNFRSAVSGRSSQKLAQKIDCRACIRIFNLANKAQTVLLRLRISD